MERGPFPWSRVCPDLSSMGFHDRPADREADAHTAFLRRRERLEELAQDFRCDARACVLHADLNHRSIMGQSGPDA